MSRQRLAAAAAQLLGRLAAERGEPAGRRDLADRHVLDLVEAHGLLPQLSQVLPQPIHEIESRGRRHGYRALRLTRELLALIDLFEAHAVRAIPFKGPALAMQLYGSPAARFYLDLDLLIPEHQLEPALALVQRRGYEPSPRVRRFLSERWWQATEQCRLARPDGDRIELHWQLGRAGFPFPLDFDALWSRREAVQLGGRAVGTIAREDLVLYLAAHGAMHAWERLEWVFDFAHLASTSTGLDWMAIAERARAYGAERAVLVAVNLASDLLGVPTPPALNPLIERDKRVRGLTARVRAYLRDGQESARRRWSSPAFRLAFFRLAVMQTMGHRARYVGHAVLSPGVADWHLVSLPDGVYWLYYVVRLLRLMGRFVHELFKSA